MQIEIIKHPSAIFIISKAVNMPFKRIIQKTRKKPQSIYRQVLMWFLFYEGVSIPGIHELTGRSRATVMYSVKLIDDLIDMNDKATIRVIDKINELKNKCNDNSDRF